MICFHTLNYSIVLCLFSTLHSVFGKKCADICGEAIEYTEPTEEEHYMALFQSLFKSKLVQVK